MKSKLLLFALCSAVCGSFFAGCGNKKSAEELAAEEAHRADSIAAAQAAEQARLDSINRAESEKMYAEALTLVPGKKNVAYVGESEFATVTLPVTVTNNTDVAINGADYVIEYVRVYEGTNSEGDFVDRTKQCTAQGQDIAPGSSVTITLKEKESLDISQPKVTLNLSADDFAARRAEAK